MSEAIILRASERVASFQWGARRVREPKLDVITCYNDLVGLKSRANPCLRVLIDGAGFSSYERFAEAVSHRAWELHGLKLCYDHVRVKRWLDGGACQHPDVVADVLSAAWGVPIPVGVIWPEQRDGAGPVPAHLQAWVPDRTLTELANFTRSDMITRRDVFANAVGVTVGAALIDPLTRWMTAGPFGELSEVTAGTAGRIGLSTVEALELADRQLRAADRQLGAGSIREAAVGQLKHAVDLMRTATYDQATGQRLLTAITGMAEHAGWLSYDVGMAGPAQQYWTYALQAAREAGTDRANWRSVASLCDMSRMMQASGRPDTAVRLVDMALDQLPADRNRYNAIRAGVWGIKAKLLASMGEGHAPEATNAVALAFDLRDRAAGEHCDPWVVGYFSYLGSEPELYSEAAESYRALAAYEPRHVGTAERYALTSLESREPNFRRSQVFDRIALAQTRILQGEPEQACTDGRAALDLASQISSSRVTARLRELRNDLAPYATQPDVRDFRDELRQAATAA